MVKPTAGNVAAEAETELKFKGVRKRKWGKWVSEIRLPNSRERIWLGSYDTQEKAARAFDAAMFCLRGKNAKFNFPGKPPEIAGGESLSPADIQAAAQRFANEAGPTEPSMGHKELLMASESLSSSSCSEVGYLVDSDLTVDWSSFLDSLAPPTDFECNVGQDYENFSHDLNDFPGDLFFPPSGEMDFGMEKGSGGFSHPSWLWNF